MPFLEQWYSNISSKEADRVRESISGRGVCKKHTGGLSLYAVVALRLEPSEALNVDDELRDEQRDRLKSEGWYDEIVYGVLDVLLTSPMTPIGQFRLVIEEVEFNELEAGKAAFRLAARYAAGECLKRMEFVVT